MSAPTTVTELRRGLDRIGVSRDFYWLEPLPDSDPPVDGGLALAPSADGTWTIDVLERDERETIGRYPDEAAACGALYDRLARRRAARLARDRGGDR